MPATPDGSIYFTPWRGKAANERVPRMAKLLNQLSFPEWRLQWIAVDDSIDFYRQAPLREEKGLNVYRVPIFIIYEKEWEIGRIVEYRNETLERDLYTLFSKRNYTSNYFSYPIINGWLAKGILTDESASVRGLSGKLRHGVMNQN